MSTCAACRKKLSREMPELSTYFQAGGLVDGVINQGLPAPIDIQIKSNDMDGAYDLAQQLASKIQAMPNVSSVYIPQSIDYPGLQLNIDRERASLIGLSAKDVVDNVITALTSDGMVAPSYWIDPQERQQLHGDGAIREPLDRQHVDGGFQEHSSARRAACTATRRCRKAARLTPDSAQFFQGDHVTGLCAAWRGGGHQADQYAHRSGSLPDSARDRHLCRHQNRGAASAWARGSTSCWPRHQHDQNTVIDVRGAVVNMNQAFHEFGVGLIIAVLLVYLILMAQFTSFIDPFIILMAIPPGLAGVVLILLLTGSTLNIMSLMGVIMMAGIVVSNSILIVEFAGILHEQGMPLLEATVESCKVRLRPILMTSLATLLGMIPMALGLEAGSEQYAPLARAIIGGLALSVVVTVFLVPAVYLVIHGRRENAQVAADGGGHE